MGIKFTERLRLIVEGVRLIPNYGNSFHLDGNIVSITLIYWQMADDKNIATDYLYGICVFK